MYTERGRLERVGEPIAYRLINQSIQKMDVKPSNTFYPKAIDEIITGVDAKFQKDKDEYAVQQVRLLAAVLKRISVDAAAETGMAPRILGLTLAAAVNAGGTDGALLMYAPDIERQFAEFKLNEGSRLWSEFDSHLKKLLEKEFLEILRSNKAPSEELSQAWGEHLDRYVSQHLQAHASGYEQYARSTLDENSLDLGGVVRERQQIAATAYAFGLHSAIRLELGRPIVHLHPEWKRLKEETHATTVIASATEAVAGTAPSSTDSPPRMIDGVILKKTILEIELSAQAFGCLQSVGIKTMEDLVRRTEDSLLEIENMDEMRLQEVKAKLAEQGLSLRMQSLLDKTLIDLNLSGRSKNALGLLEINTLSDIVKHTADELLVLRSFGTHSLNEVKEKIAGYGFHLAGDK